MCLIISNNQRFNRADNLYNAVPNGGLRGASTTLYTCIAHQESGKAKSSNIDYRAP